MRRFQMYRRGDIPGGHTIGNPADEVQFEGVVFADGRVALRWLTPFRSTVAWDSMEDMLAVHGHPEYGSELIWLDA